MSEKPVDYHADLSHYGNSMLSDYVASPLLFWMLYIARMIPRGVATAAMEFGRLLHCLLLEREKFAERYLVASTLQSRRGNSWKEIVAEAAETNREAVLPVQVEMAEVLVAAIHKHPIASQWLAAEVAIFEEPIYWTDPETQLPLKCKPDIRIEYEDFVLCPDVKTSISPGIDEFTKQAYNLGYHRQAALYTAGCRTTTDKKCMFAFIVVGKEFPHDVFTYECSPEFIRRGEFENMEILARLAASLKNDDWTLPNQNKVQTLYLPGWVK